MKNSLYKELICQSHCCFLLCKAFLNNAEKVTDFMFLEVNRAFENLSGFKASEIINKKASESLPSSVEGIFDWKDIFERIASDGAIQSDVVRSEQLRNSFTVSGYSPEPHHFAIIFTDAGKIDGVEKPNVEEMNATHYASDADIRIKSVFLAAISHQLRAPLNHILGFSEIIKKNAVDYEIKEFASIIHKSGSRFMAVIEDIFDLIMTENALMKMRPESFSGLDLFMEARHKLEALVKDSGNSESIELVFTPSQYLYTNIYFADKTKILQVLSNLFQYVVRNTDMGMIHFGFKAITPKTLSFYVKFAKNKDQLLTINNVFDYINDVADCNLHSIYNDSNAIGLALSCKISKAMQGELYEEIINEDLSSVNFNFPINTDSFDDKPNRENDVGKVNDLSNSTIMLVDDDMVALKMIKRMLSGTNVTIITAKNGEKAVEEFSNHPEIDLVFMDLMMPVMDGYTATKQIKSIDPGVPVIAMTANTFIIDQRKAQDAGCDGFLTKPVQSSLLMAEIKKHLR